MKRFRWKFLKKCFSFMGQEEKAKAKDLHPKLLAGMFFFFALGATGGVTSLLTSDKPILERCRIYFFSIILFLNKSIKSLLTWQKNWTILHMIKSFFFLFRLLFSCSPHAVTAFIGLTLLTIQTVLPSLFEVRLTETNRFSTGYFFWVSSASFHWSNSGIIFIGKSWIAKCAWDFGQWHYDIVPRSCSSWTSTRIEFLILSTRTIIYIFVRRSIFGINLVVLILLHRGYFLYIEKRSFYLLFTELKFNCYPKIDPSCSYIDEHQLPPVD